MDIFISINNREEVIQIPVIPPEFNVSTSNNNEKYNTVKHGDINLIGLRGLKDISFSSFFPIRDYPFLRDRSLKGWEYIEKIESWIDRRLPIRLVITDTGINLPVTIDNFEYGIKNGSGDIYYTLSFTEFKFINFKEVK